MCDEGLKMRRWIVLDYFIVELTRSSPIPSNEFEKDGETERIQARDPERSGTRVKD